MQETAVIYMKPRRPPWGSLLKSIHTYGHRRMSTLTGFKRLQGLKQMQTVTDYK